MAKIKLSKSQIEIVKLLQSDEKWEIGQRTGWGGNTWMQLGGLGRGGNTKNVSVSTFASLASKGIIDEKKHDSPWEQPRRYQLTELGKTISLD